MPAAIKLAKNQIATDWAALTPETDARRTYFLISTKEIPTGASAHRGFYFVPITGGLSQDWGDSSEIVLTEIRAVLRYSRTGNSLDDFFDRVTDEAITLQLAVNHRSNWPAGVLEVRCEKWELTIDSDAGDPEIVFSIYITTEES